MCVFSVEKSVLGADVVVSFNERPQTFFPGCRNERPSAPDESWWRKLQGPISNDHVSDLVTALPPDSHVACAAVARSLNYLPAVNRLQNVRYKQIIMIR